MLHRFTDALIAFAVIVGFCALASAGTINVPGDQPTIQAGINAATSGVDEVVVAPGTYHEIIDLGGKAITVRSSGGAAVTTIDATTVVDPGTGKPVVRCDSGESAGTVLDGFTITGGTGDLFWSVVLRGGGMFIHGASPTVTNCNFSMNTAYSGGGLFCESSTAHITNSTFRANVATGATGGGMCISSNADVTVSGCRFIENEADLTMGSGGGIGWAGITTNMTVQNSSFVGNTAKYGGGISVYSNCNMLNCLFTGNEAGEGGAIFGSTSSSPPTVSIVNCTIAQNTATSSGGIRWFGFVTIANSIIHGNSSGSLSNPPSDFDAFLTHCDIEGGWLHTFPGTDNIDADPLFVDADGADNIAGTEDDDLRLSAGSPCIDSAAYDYYGGSALDFAGNNRTIDDPSTVDTGTGSIPYLDRGALEYVTGACCLPGGCMQLPPAPCADLGGSYAGDGAACGDNDSDGDGVGDLCDQCPNDPDKIVPGECGCGLPATLTGETFDFTFGSGGTGDGQFNLPDEIALDAAGRMYIADAVNNRIQVFNNAGTFLFSFGNFGTGNGQFDEPHGVDVDATGRIYVADSKNNRIQVFDITGGFLFKFGSFGSSTGQFDSPYAVAVDGAGRICVADSFNDRIQVFDNTGGFVLTFGMNGSNNGQFDAPYGICTDQSGRIYVAEANNHRVQVFTDTGGFLFKFGTFGSGNGQLNAPDAVAVDTFGHIIVADTFNHRVQLFDSSGQFLFRFGSNGSGDGQFQYSPGVAVDVAGRIYVTDYLNARIQVFDPIIDCLAPCFADIVDNDFQPGPNGTVNGADLGYLLSQWGPNPGSIADFVTSSTFQPPPDGVVDGADLAVLLGTWGPCD